MKCKICGNKVSQIFNAKILGKYNIKYFYCDNCKFIQTEEPFWLEEAYADAIAITDTGQISRNLNNAKRLKIIIPFLSKNPKELKCLDYGGGYGILVRLMRDIGYDFFWYDKYCSNLFAIGFEADKYNNYNIITAFEIFEHLPYPLAEIQNMLMFGNPDFLIFSTNVYTKKIPDKDWWYYSFETGQHISIYNLKTLEYIANKFNFHLLTDNKNLHIFTKKNLSNKIFNLYIKTSKRFPLLNGSKLKSKTFDDHVLLRNKFNENKI